MAGKLASTILTTLSDSAFSTSYSSGATVPYSGIYKCSKCGREVTSNAQKNDVFPPHFSNSTCSTPAWVLHIATDTQGNSFT